MRRISIPLAALMFIGLVGSAAPAWSWGDRRVHFVRAPAERDPLPSLTTCRRPSIRQSRNQLLPRVVGIQVSSLRRPGAAGDLGHGCRSCTLGT